MTGAGARRSGCLLLTTLVLASCGGEKTEGRSGERASLGGDAVARVGDVTIRRALVVEVARAQRVSAADALKRLVDDAVAAQAATAQGLDRASPARWRTVAARARGLSERLLREAREAGPPTDDEVRELSALHWLQVDRPVTVRVVHSVVRPSSPEKASEVRAVATRLRARVVEAKDEADFLARAKEVAAEVKGSGVEVIAESLGVFDEDGRSVEGGNGYVKAFAAGAHALASPGETSGLVETEFGTHVIRLLERFPEQRMPFETRRVAFTEEVAMRRARAAYEKLLEVARKRAPVEILPSAERSMRELHGAERRP